MGFGLLALVACSIVTPIYIKILYPNLYEAVVDLNVLVNVAQIFYFLTNVLLVIILTMCEIRWQFVIQAVSYTHLNPIASETYAAVAAATSVAYARIPSI